MTIRSLTVERRVVGTINQQPSFACHYVTRSNDESPALAADFMIAAAIAHANGSPSAGTFVACSEAVRAYGRALGGTDGSHDEHTEFTGAGPDYAIKFRDIPPIGNPPSPRRYTLQDVKDAPGVPSAADFDAVVAAMIAYGDSVAA
jgi:hypothetical protein